MKISVITVVLNGEKTIERTIQSVIDQKYLSDVEIEYILVDGKSADATLDIIDHYKEWIDVFVSDKDDGIYDAMNKGLLRASGDVIAFLNSGDRYIENTCKIVDRCFVENDMEVLIGRASVVDGEVVTRIRNNHMSDIAYSMPCCHQAVFAKRTIFEEIGGFDTRYKIGADYDWIQRVYHAGKKVQEVDDILVDYDANGISSSNLLLSLEESRQIALKYVELYEDGEQIKSRIENNYVLRKKKLEEMRYFQNLLIKNKDLVWEMLQGNTSCYIWGAAEMGRWCSTLLKQVGIVTKAFLDSGKYGTLFMGCDVLKPDDVSKSETIFIASSKYKDEIYMQAIELGFSQDKLIIFPDFLGDVQKEVTE